MKSFIRPETNFKIRVSNVFDFRLEKLVAKHRFCSKTTDKTPLSIQDPSVNPFYEEHTTVSNLDLEKSDV